jgi:hypothetical protein
MSLIISSRPGDTEGAIICNYTHINNKDYIAVINTGAILEADYYMGDKDIISILERALEAFDEICKKKIEDGISGETITIYSEDVIAYYIPDLKK